MTLEQVREHEEQAAAILWRRIWGSEQIMTSIETLDPDTASLIERWAKAERNYQDSQYAK